MAEVNAWSGEEAGVAELAVVLAFEVGVEAEVDLGAQLGAVAAEVLVEQDGVDGGAGDAAGLGGDVDAEVEERRAGFLVADGDEEDGAVRLVLVVADGVVGVVAAVAADAGEQRVDLLGVDGLVDERSELAQSGYLHAVGGRFDLDQ